VTGPQGIVSRVPCRGLRPMSVDAGSKEDLLIFPNVLLLLPSIILVECVDCALGLGDGLLTFRLGCSVTRLYGLLLLFAPFSGKVH